MATLGLASDPTHAHANPNHLSYYSPTTTVVTLINFINPHQRPGLDVTINGRGFDPSTTQSVEVGGRACTTLHANSTTVVCTTSGYDEDSSEDSYGNDPGYSLVTVRQGVNTSVASVCVAPPVIRTVDRGLYHNYTAAFEGWAPLNLTQNFSQIEHTGCEFRFSSNTSHTPYVSQIEPAWGAEGQAVTITGQGFAESGNIVSLGYLGCPVAMENSSTIVCTAPRHVGGTYAATVNVPQRGWADGIKLWFRFTSGVTSITPRAGSKFAGQRITITGFGFAPAKEHHTNLTANEQAYHVMFHEW